MVAANGFGKRIENFKLELLLERNIQEN